MTEQQASVSDGVTTDPAAPEEAAPEEQTDETKERKQLLDKHAQQGRELAAERSARVKAETRATELEAEREKAQYEQMDEDKKAEYRRNKDAQSKEAPKTANLSNERDLLRIIAQTEDPKITKALSALYWRSEERGKFPDKEQVLAVVEGLTPDPEEEETEKEEKPPVRVTATRGTRVNEPSIDEEVKAAETSLKSKDGKYTYGDLLGLRQRRDAAKAQAAR